MKLSDILIKKLPYWILQISVIVVLAFFLTASRTKKPVPTQTPIRPIQATTTEAIPQTPTTSQQTSTPKPVTFSTLRLEAKAAIVYDVNSAKILYAKNINEHLPIASITKVMTAFTASTYLPADTIITISQEEALVESSAGIVAGERWPIKALTAFTLTSSSNGGAKALARATEETTFVDFISQMNGLAKELGLSETLFRNPTGLDIYDGQMSGSYSTALDIAKLFTYISENDSALMSGTNRGSLAVYSADNVRHQAINTNLLVAKVPNIEMSKTGFTDLAGGNVAIVFEPKLGRKVAVVILGSSSQGRFTDLEKLVKTTIQSLSKGS